MGYQALLFCPDEKLARVVSQLFNELDFSIDPVNEPFAAVKKLMAQRYDAIVVDCDNEQNTSLLFKSARNSNPNQGSLAIALVEGQTGVAKAYRIGANLVLTKPINLEQCKGTLRVARGLLRKGAEGTTGATGAGAPTPKAAPVAGSTPVRPAQPSAPSPAAATTAAPKIPVSPKVETALPAMVAAAKPAETPATSSAPVMQAITPLLEDHTPKRATALASTDMDRRKEERVKPLIPASVSSVPQGSQGAAAAPAPAPAEEIAPADQGIAEERKTQDQKKQEKADEKEKLAQEKKKEETTISELPAIETPKIAAAAVSEQSSGSGISEAPTFAALGVEDASASGSSKKILFGAIALVVVVALAYFAWTQFGQSHPSTAPKQAAPSVTEPAQQSSAPAAAIPMSAPAPAPTTTLERASNSAAAHPSKPVSQAAKPSANDAPEITLNSEPEVKKSAETPIRVKPAPPASKAQSVEEAAAQVPNIEATNRPDLNGILSSTNAAKPTLARVKLSQGILQGLLIKRVAPKYPAAALSTNIEGMVHIEATINKEGMVVNPKVVKGDRVLAAAALDAVRQWRYKPYYLDGEPVDVDTEITINFKTN